MDLLSGIYKQYYESFILDEDGLRRIHGLLEKASRELDTETGIMFHVKREDDRYYETTSVDEVLSDPNVPGKRIQMVSVMLRHTKEFDELRPYFRDVPVEVTFSSGRPRAHRSSHANIDLRISTNNKSWALLLADEIEPQIERSFRVKRTPRWLLLLFVFSVYALIWNPLQQAFFGESKPPSKQSFLIFGLTSSLASYFLGLKISNQSKWMIQFFGPEASFFWGEELHRYQNRESVRQNLQWSVLVAFLVSISASIFFAFAPGP